MTETSPGSAPAGNSPGDPATGATGATRATGGALPKGLIAGTALFAILAAVSVAALIHFGKSHTEAESAQHLKDQAINVSQEEMEKRGR